MKQIEAMYKKGTLDDFIDEACNFRRDMSLVILHTLEWYHVGNKGRYSINSLTMQVVIDGTVCVSVEDRNSEGGSLIYYEYIRPNKIVEVYNKWKDY